MDNPYSTPKSDVEVINTSNIMHHFTRFSAWWVFLLTAVTFGIYTVYWLYTRTQTINSLHHRRITETVVWGGIVVFILYTALSLVPENTFPSQPIIVLLATLAYMFFFLWWIFSVRNRLMEIVRENGNPDYTLNPVMTFFFQNIYMQYKINEQIDQSAVDVTMEAPIQESAN
jgi:glucan phosphoethanolaminetransferase (alkaline phosphatase superfamily)